MPPLTYLQASEAARSTAGRSAGSTAPSTSPPSIFMSWAWQRKYSQTKTINEMKTKNEILHLLTLYKPTAESKYGLTRIGIFGSVARGEQTEESDVDVCYEGKAPSLLTLDLIQTDLERMLGSRVDLVRVRDGMNSLLRERIRKEAVYV